MKQARINIKEKKCLNDIYCEKYDLMADLGKAYLDLQGKKQLELGSGGGAMSGSNQALSYILLKRDREEFDKLFPDLKVVYKKPFNCLHSCGGMWLKPKLPEFMFGALKYVEKCCAPLMYLFGFHLYPFSTMYSTAFNIS